MILFVTGQPSDIGDAIDGEIRKARESENLPLLHVLAHFQDPVRRLATNLQDGDNTREVEANIAVEQQDTRIHIDVDVSVGESKRDAESEGSGVAG